MTIRANVIKDSISEEGVRITTLQLRYPRFIHAEFMTHRVFSRNASSSRAIPVKRLIQDIIDDPVYPSYWGANQKGMQAGKEIDKYVTTGTITWTGPIDTVKSWFGIKPEPKVDKILNSKTEVWDMARAYAIKIAEAYDEAGYHKQIVNRLLEPFSHINVVVTATEWNNFFALRCHEAAQPEMRMLAEAIRGAMNASSPRLLKIGQWHLPYVYDDEYSYMWPIPIQLSVARCARVSYLTTEGSKPTVTEDTNLYDRLVGSVPLHASPAEHQATPDERYTQVLKPTQFDIGEATIEKWRQPELHKNFKGWIQYRATLPGENVE